MQPSSKLYSLLEGFEGLRLQAYQDIAGIWTIAYGTTYYPDGTAVKEGDTCTKEEAQLYMSNALTHFVNHLNATITSQLNPNQFDGLVSFTYNVGTGAWDTSSLRQQVNIDPNDYPAITADFAKWNKIHKNGELIVSTDLIGRRQHEAHYYQFGI